MGWLQNLWNRIKGNRQQQLPESNITNYNIINNTMDSWKVDISEMNGKSRTEMDMEEAVNLARNGLDVQELKNRFQNLTSSQIHACFMIGISKQATPEQIEKVGGTEALVSKMVKQAVGDAKSFGYIESEAHRYMPSALTVMNKMLDEKKVEEYRDSFRIKHPQRMTRLKQLYDEAVHLIGPYGNNIYQDTLLSYMNRNGYNIQVGGENPYLEEVDVNAVLNVANAVARGFLKREDIDRVGGPAKLLDEMSVSAKINAKDFGYNLNQAKNYIPTIKDTISNMPQVDGRIQEF